MGIETLFGPSQLRLLATAIFGAATLLAVLCALVEAFSAPSRKGGSRL